MDTFHLK